MVEVDLVRAAGRTPPRPGTDPRPARTPRADNATPWPWPWPWHTFTDWLSADVDVRPASRSRGRDVTPVVPTVDGTFKPARGGSALASSDSRLFTVRDVVVAEDFEPPFTTLFIFDVRDAAKLDALLTAVACWWPSSASALSVPLSQRLARLDAVALIREQRRDAESDLDSAVDTGVSPMLAPVLPYLALVPPTSRLLIGRSATDVFTRPAALWPWSAIFLDGRGPSDCRLEAVLTLRRGSFSGWVDIVAALWSCAGLVGAATEPGKFLVAVFVVRSGSRSCDSDFESSVMSDEKSTATGRSFPLCLCNSASVDGWRLRSQSWSSSSPGTVVSVQSRDVAVLSLRRCAAALGGASYETSICPPSSVSNSSVARRRLGDSVFELNASAKHVHVKI